VLPSCGSAGPPSRAFRANCEQRLDLLGADGRVDLDALLAELARRQINEVHVEAGATLIGALLAAGRVDELLLYQAPSLIGDGAALVRLPGVEKLDQRLHMTVFEQRRVGSDLRLRLRPSNSR
jgi:diaminohydroxyphosphoribosylaminopyrimidine deaminase/5-amino-6-(5-phosphoribosylamino)uracil reductase